MISTLYCRCSLSLRTRQWLLIGQRIMALFHNRKSAPNLRAILTTTKNRQRTVVFLLFVITFWINIPCDRYFHRLWKAGALNWVLQQRKSLLLTRGGLVISKPINNLSASVQTCCTGCLSCHPPLFLHTHTHTPVTDLTGRGQMVNAGQTRRISRLEGMKDNSSLVPRGSWRGASGFYRCFTARELWKSH